MSLFSIYGMNIYAIFTIFFNRLKQSAWDEHEGLTASLVWALIWRFSGTFAFSCGRGKEFVFNRIRTWFSSVWPEEAVAADFYRGTNCQEYPDSAVPAQYHWKPGKDGGKRSDRYILPFFLFFKVLTNFFAHFVSQYS